MKGDKINVLILILISISFAGKSQISVQFEALPSGFNANLPDPVYAKGINYDDIDPEKQFFHLFLPDTLKSYPLVVYIHGGGFTGGSANKVLTKEREMNDMIYCLENGLAYAGLDYRLIHSSRKGMADNEGVIKCLNDSKRAIQFIRYHAEELHIVPEKIALMGNSAGAGTSLWLAVRSDMADPDADDPVLRESTRVSAVVINGVQASYDLYRWETAVFNNYDGHGSSITLNQIADALSFERGSNFYGGLESIDQLLSDPDLIQYRQDVDMLYHLSEDDPPIFIHSPARAVKPGDNLLHHALHGKAVYDAAIAANVSGVRAYIPALSINTTDNESANDFLIRHLIGTPVKSNLGATTFSK